jgi:hypothetical protein
MIEDCFDGSSVYGYHFDKAWDRDSIMELRELGELEYFSTFPKPFFRLIGQNGLQVKGVQGFENCRVIYPKKEKEVVKQHFEIHFASQK